MAAKFTWTRLLLWTALNIMVVILMDLAMFHQTSPQMKDATFLTKLKWAELWASLEWIFLIPTNRIGNLFLSAPQISLSSFVFDFLGQIATNKYLDTPTTIDDYIGMVIILGGMGISAYKLLG